MCCAFAKGCTHTAFAFDAFQDAVVADAAVKDALEKLQIVFQDVELASPKFARNTL